MNKDKSYDFFVDVSGFGETSYFSKSFKEVFRISPADYRKKSLVKQ